ncbi:ABC transporter permease [Catenuloplanes indicus]|uniref:Glycine betaine/proline transport system permease protein n=1 Tax=Catenuloplanes indicus TaxID=137267 RepID=A0AAE4AXG3_9ACTN|nr:ABC transporter permease subunit [Catenuloplanes indicus]MDQ0365716.1 glycine betaine/proline transport system permease protein [Catenuloplanes indicus]
MTAATAALRGGWRPGRGTLVAVLVVVVAGGYLLLRGRATLPHDNDAAAFRMFTDLRDWVDANRDVNPVFLFVVNYLRLGVALLVGSVQALLSGLGWAGLTVTAGALAAVLAGWRIAVLTVAGFLSFGVLGLWAASVDTLALTVSAVLLAVAIGLPLGVLAARSDRVRAVLDPVLDVMQIMPAFAYLAPMTLLFLIGEPASVLATLIYAIPPAIRISALGIRGVSATTVEAATSAGATRRQLLCGVRLPMARRAIVLAVNQTIMMALSMVVITALIDAPGLGQVIIRALERVNVGLAFDAGVAIVVMAIVLDRLTSRAADRADRTTHHPPSGADAARRPPSGAEATGQVPGDAGAGTRWPRLWRRPWPAGVRRRLSWAGAVLAVVVGALVNGGPEFPEAVRWSFAPVVNDVVRWIELTLYPVTDAVKNVLTAGVLNPLQAVLTTSPFWLVLAAVLGLGVVVSGVRAALAGAGALAGIAALGLWQHAMETLATVLLATVLTLLAGVALGVLTAGSDLASRGLRPVLDAAQTMPSFVYLLPAVALFGASRFTAIAASVIYAVPPVARLVERGLRDVPGTVVEAALSAGSTRTQLLWKVRLPVARPALLLAANQGIVMVLAMVVVGGLVGAGALGYDVVAGFAQRSDFGRGFAAGLAIVLLGVLLDRLTQGAGTERKSA